ncbi:MAG: amidohydrolase [Clostridia bacterium]|nr:amidohydrolase [Clostridia bacterium]
MISWYQELHRHPERSRKEYKTAARLENWLTEIGLEVCRVGDTSVVGILKGGKPGKQIALRADMDALPVTEQTGLPYASENEGIMHACGHDFHMAALLGAARLLEQKRAEICGTVQFIFQSDEEEDGYADILSSHEIMKSTVAVFGAHVDPTLPAGIIGIRSGPFYATAGKFDIVFHGKSAHGAHPQDGIDALAAAAEVVPKILALRQPDEAMVSVGTLHSGQVRNIIADRAELSGIIRVATPQKRQQVFASIQSILDETEITYGVTVQAEFSNGYKGITNPPECAAFVKDAAIELFGQDKVYDIPQMRMITEDFGEYLTGRTGCFYHIGVGGNEGLHSSRFAPDPSLLTTAATLHAHIVTSYLKGESI